MKGRWALEKESSVDSGDQVSGGCSFEAVMNIYSKVIKILAFYIITGERKKAKMLT